VKRRIFKIRFFGKPQNDKRGRPRNDKGASLGMTLYVILSEVKDLKIRFFGKPQNDRGGKSQNDKGASLGMTKGADLGMPPCVNQSNYPMSS